MYSKLIKTGGIQNGHPVHQQQDSPNSAGNGRHPEAGVSIHEHPTDGSHTSTPQSTLESTPPSQINAFAFKVDQTLVKTLSMAALTEIIGGVVHEINNPLQVIMGRTQIARLGKKTEESLQIIESQAMRIATIMRGLQSFAHRENEKTERIDLNTMITSVMNLVKTQFYKRGIQIEVSVEDVPVFWGNPLTFQQILLSALLNAKKRLSYNGKLKIRAAFSEKKCLLLEISDSAPIMNPQLIADIEKPFLEALSNPAADEYFGLIASIQMVQFMGGSVTIEPVSETGNRMRFEVPVCQHKDVYAYVQGEQTI